MSDAVLFIEWFYGHPKEGDDHDTLFFRSHVPTKGVAQVCRVERMFSYMWVYTSHDVKKVRRSEEEKLWREREDETHISVSVI